MDGNELYEDEETEITASKHKYRKLIQQIREYLKMKFIWRR